jgi:hypothetical protein
MSYGPSAGERRFCKYLSVLALVFMILGISIHLAWFYSNAQGFTHEERVDTFNSFFPSWLHGDLMDTPRLPAIAGLQVALLILAILLAVSSMWGAGRIFRIINFIVLLLSVLALPLTAWMLL